MKLFCILEQGKYINHPITLKKVKLFNTEYSDFYRFNWKEETDPNASWTTKDCKGSLRFSEGRNLLFDKVKKDYKYYIFTDEDIVFKTYPENTEDSGLIIERLVDFLQKWRPVGGTLYTQNIAWGVNGTILPQMEREGRPLLCRRHDACIGVLREDFARIVYPIQYQGSDGVTIYQQFLAQNLFPQKYMFCPGLTAVNSIEEQHHHTDDRKEDWKDKVVSLFENNLSDNSYSEYMQDRRLVPNTPGMPSNSAEPVSIQDIQKIYNIHRDGFLNTRIYL